MARVLVINPGSTSTKVAVFDDEKEIAQENITHGNEELASFPKTSDQASAWATGSGTSGT